MLARRYQIYRLELTTSFNTLQLLVMARSKGNKSGHFKIAVLLLVVLVHLGGIHASKGDDDGVVSLRAHTGRFPFLVSVNDQCSGAIIKSRNGWTYVLTSAQCALTKPSQSDVPPFVRIDGYNLLKDDGKKVAIREIKVHEHYTSPTGDYVWNLAIIEVETSVPSNHVISWRSYRAREPRVDAILRAIGWDNAEDGCSAVSGEHILMVLEHKFCRILPNEYNLCLTPGVQRRPCNGSCSDILVVPSRRPSLVGISTFKQDESCDENSNPRMYTWIGHELHQEWINRKLKAFQG